jgi:DNA mismatch repair protein MutS
MAGKSTFLRQNAIIAILAHIGSFVPAVSATIGLVDKIFSRVGAGDDLTKGQSTFMVEMLETSAILSQSTNKSLVILDEVGRGTSTYDGVAIAWSVLEYIHDKIKARCLFATHYHELTNLSEIFPALINYTISINDNDGKILFLHKIIKGFADRSYGVHVAQMAGLPPSVIRRANQLLIKFEKDTKKSNKEAFKGESQNLNLFELANKEMDKYKEIYDFCSQIDPNELSPKEALDILYKLKNLFTKNSDLTFS